MQAIILAAGMGRRLGYLTAGNTKCMLEVNGIRLIDRVLDTLKDKNLSNIVIVTGYAGDNLTKYVRDNYPSLPVTFIENSVFDHTNNIYSLWLAKEFLEADDTLLLESDLIYEPAVIDCALDSPYPDVALVAKYKPWMDGTMVELDERDNIISFIPRSKFDFSHAERYFKTVNVYKLSRNFATQRYIPFLEAYIKAMGNNEYYEQVLRVLTTIDTCDIKAVDIGDLKWYEIDDIQDLKIAETIFADPEQRLKLLQSSFGGYWRHSEIKDFCYLVNPFFPPAKMMEEMKASFDVLLREYPSGMDVNSMLAAKYFGLHKEMILVGNGAAELIKELTASLPLPCAAVCPTFEEYLNRLPQEGRILFQAPPPLFRYSADDLIRWCEESDAPSLILVNPDNPSGNFIPRSDLLRLADWAEGSGVRLIVDESFVDFASDGPAESLLNEETLLRYPRLIVLKSISKSYGVPGLRLGVLASADVALIAQMKKSVAIWNINSFAEFYMQIFGKYEADYSRACALYAEERDWILDRLKEVEWLTVAPSQANFILARIDAPISAHALAVKLLKDYNVLIKDCTGKRGFDGSDRFIRIAVRDRNDNSYLLRALHDLRF